MAPVFQKGDRFGEGGQYVAVRKLGEGQFAEVWEAKDTAVLDADVRYACKIERNKEWTSVRQEYKMLKRLNGVCQHVCPVFATGTHEGRFFVMLKLLGANLHEERKRCPGGRMPLASVLAVGASTLSALREVHEQGFIHRDVKPANFALDPDSADAGTWIAIDFGLARKYVDEAGNHAPQRPQAAFRGSTTYASVHSHEEQDLSRRDDLWSWLYMMVELADGALPWRIERRGSPGGEAAAAREETKQAVYELKKACLDDPVQLFTTGELPEAMRHISEHLKSLAYADTPDYNHIQGWLAQLPDALPPTPHTAAALAMPPPAWSGAVPPGAAALAPAGINGFTAMPFAGQYAGNGHYTSMSQHPMQGWAGILADTPASPPADTPASPPAPTPLSPPQQQQHYQQQQLYEQQQVMEESCVPAGAADAGAGVHVGDKRGYAVSTEEQAPAKRVRSDAPEASSSQQRQDDGATRSGRPDRARDASADDEKEAPYFTRSYERDRDRRGSGRSDRERVRDKSRDKERDSRDRTRDRVRRDERDREYRRSERDEVRERDERRSTRQRSASRDRRRSRSRSCSRSRGAAGRRRPQRGYSRDGRRDREDREGRDDRDHGRDGRDGRERGDDRQRSRERGRRELSPGASVLRVAEQGSRRSGRDGTDARNGRDDRDRRDDRDGRVDRDGSDFRDRDNDRGSSWHRRDRDARERRSRSPGDERQRAGSEVRAASRLGSDGAIKDEGHAEQSSERQEGRRGGSSGNGEQGAGDAAAEAAAAGCATANGHGAAKTSPDSRGSAGEGSDLVPDVVSPPLVYSSPSEMLEYMQHAKTAGLSAAGKSAMQALSALQGLELVGTIALMLDRMTTQCAPDCLPTAAQLLEDMAAYCSDAAARAKASHAKHLSH